VHDARVCVSCVRCVSDRVGRVCVHESESLKLLLPLRERLPLLVGVIL
jgi:hypothetical protein